MEDAGEMNLLMRMRQRFEEATAERDSIQTAITSLETRIRIDQQKAPRFPLESEDKLSFEIKQLEFHRETNSLSLSDEKKLIKQIEGFKAKRSGITAYKNYQDAMDTLRQRRLVLVENMQAKENALTDLQKGLKRVELAERLGVDPLSMVILEVAVPENFYGAVIGKGQARKRAIEKECGVEMELHRAEHLMLITGTAETAERAKEMLEDITLGVIQAVPVPPARFNLLMARKGALLQLLQNEHKVKLDLDRGTGQVRIRGRPEPVAAAAAALLSAINGQAEVVVPAKLLPAVIGRGGANFKLVEETHGVSLDVDRAAGVVRICGAEGAVTDAAHDVQRLVDSNEEHEFEIPIDQEVVGEVVGKGGASIRALQTASGAYFNIDRTTPSAPVLRIRGTSEKLAKGKAAAQELLANIESNTLKIDVGVDVVNAIIGGGGGGGGGGNALNTLRSSTGASVDLNRVTGVIRIRGDEEARGKAAAAVAELVSANQTADVSVDSQLFGVLVGKGGANISKMQSDSGANITINRAAGTLRVRGTVEAIAAAKEAIGVIVAANQLAELTVGPDDVKLLVSQSGALVRRLQDESGAEISVSKGSESVVRLRGSEEAVERARAGIMAELGLADSDNVAIMKVDAESLGAVIGRGGSTIKKLQEEHGVSIEVMRSALSLRLRGEPDAVAAAMEAVTKLLDEMQVTGMVRVEASGRKHITPSLIRRVQDATNATITMNSSGGGNGGAGAEAGAAPAAAGALRIRGNVRDVADAKAALGSIAAGNGRRVIQVAPGQASAVCGESGSSNLARVRAECGVEISVEGEDKVVVSGSVAGVAKGTPGVTNILSFFFPTEFAVLSMPAGAIGSLRGAGRRALTAFERECGGAVMCADPVGEVMYVSGTAAAVTAAKAKVEAELTAFARRHGSVAVTSSMIPSLIGRGGGALKKLREESGVDSVDIDRENNVVHVRGNEEAVVAAVTSLNAFVETYKRENFEVSVDSSMMGSIIGKGGARVKALQEESGAALDFDRSRGVVRVKGSEEAVKKAVEAITAIIGENQATEVEVADSRMFAALIGKGGVVVRGIQERSGASIDFNRERGLVLIRGGAEAVEAARTEVAAVMAAEAQQQQQQQDEREKRRASVTEENSGAGSAGGNNSRSTGANNATASANGNSAQAAAAAAELEEKESDAAATARAWKSFPSVPVGAAPGAAGFEEVSGKSKNARRRHRKKQKEGGAPTGGLQSEQDIMALLLGPTGSNGTTVPPTPPPTTTTTTTSLPPGISMSALLGGGNLSVSTPTPAVAAAPDAAAAPVNPIDALLMGAGSLGLAPAAAAGGDNGPGYYVSSCGFKVRL